LSTYVDVTTALITVAGHAGARLVYDDTWMYGKVDGLMREDSSIRPVCYKGVLRALAAELRSSRRVAPRSQRLRRRDDGRKAMWPGVDGQA